MKTCETCRFWRVEISVDDDDGKGPRPIGECRLQPPRIVDPYINRSMLCGEPDYGHVVFASLFPHTWSDSWCGQHEENR